MDVSGPELRQHEEPPIISQSRCIPGLFPEPIPHHVDGQPPDRAEEAGSSVYVAC